MFVLATLSHVLFRLFRTNTILMYVVTYTLTYIVLVLNTTPDVGEAILGV